MGGDLRLVHPPADVAAVLRLTGLDRAFVVADEVSAAITPAGEAPAGEPDA
jgi:anti-anti-sigma regulatory factor